jgi:protocatechuate 3,4-dioxygenase beta subunit
MNKHFPWIAVLLCLSALLTHAANSNTFDPTSNNVEGLYYKTNSPKRNVLLEEGMKGTRVILKGRVLSTQGKPIPNVQLDFWQADAEGRYDTKGFRLRGHQFSDKDGRYWLETIVPASYLNRAPHIHVRLTLPNQRMFVTQLFFTDDSHNHSDSLFKENLVMEVYDTENGKEATFDFILDMSV